jgi:serine/threonine protein kinase
MAFPCIRCKSEIDPKYKACPFCGEPITDFLRRYLNEPIDGKYQILSGLGTGGMGEVYKVLHVHLNATRVIKVMRSKIANDPGAHARFLREARLATRIQHPNVATLFDFSTLEDGSRYMVWEYIEGKNLHQLIEQSGPLSPRHAAKLAVEVLYGLDAIHRAGIVHRDISPENIMISRDEDGERVKLIDLGIAKQGSDEGADKTKTGLFVGKWKYCSPEHLGMLGKGEQIDGRADLYSFGIVLYEMLTGLAPFQATTPHGFLLLHSSERPQALREVNPTVTASPELERIIFHALEKNRANRFATARDFASAIQPLIPLLDDKPGAAPAPVVIELTEDLTRPSGDLKTLRYDPGATVRTLEPEWPPTAATSDTVPTVAESLESRPTFVEGPSSGAPTLVTGQPGSTTALDTVEIRPARSAHPAAETEIDQSMRSLRSRRWNMTVAAAAALVIIATSVVLYSKAAPAPDVLRPANGPVAVRASAHLGINAFPWGEVRSIRNLASGKLIELKQPLVTPAPIDLEPGKYEITLSNPAFQNAILRTVELRSGEQQLVTVQFEDAAKASLPRLEDDRP